MKVTKPDSEKINYFIWQDIRPVQFMTTVHDDADFKVYREKSRTRRKKIVNHEKKL
jgi:hypothetical protein